MKAFKVSSLNEVYERINQLSSSLDLSRKLEPRLGVTKIKHDEALINIEDIEAQDTDYDEGVVLYLVLKPVKNPEDLFILQGVTNEFSPKHPSKIVKKSSSTPNSPAKITSSKTLKRSQSATDPLMRSSDSYHEPYSNFSATTRRLKCSHSRSVYFELQTRNSNKKFFQVYRKYLACRQSQ